MQKFFRKLFRMIKLTPEAKATPAAKANPVIKPVADQEESSASKKEVLHFLHIGKTGGSAIKFALGSSPIPEARFQIILHPHEFRLRDVPVGEKFLFFLREPISRFVSGFYSRKRKGFPRYNVKWTPAEAIAFTRFETPNELAKALSAPDPVCRQQAEEAMRAIVHVNNSYWDWLEDEEYLESRFPDLLLIGFQETLSTDFQTLKLKANLPESIQLPTDEINTHRNPEGIDKRLEPEAIENLQKWYARDLECIDFCRRRAPEINDAINAKSSPPSARNPRTGLTSAAAARLQGSANPS